MKGVISMKNIYIRTSDIFGYKDEVKRIKYFDFCHKKALKCGLICQCHIDGRDTKLFIAGPKWDVIRYYLATVFNSDDYIIDAIKRIISLILT